MTLRVHRNIKAQIDGEITTQTLLGKEYLVAPVIAMVEGVRFGANAGGNGELGLADEFQKTPAGWNSKPVVLNHPQVDGQFVSANSPTVLEDYYMGLIMHTEPVDKKLRMEAWLDISTKDNSDEIRAMYDRVESGEVVEVSVGMFTDIEEQVGYWNGEKYDAIWRNIVPDHLALLEEGTIGACSVEDGCGTHRNQSKLRGDNMPKDIKAQEECGCDAPENCDCVDKPVILGRTLKGFKVNSENEQHVTINHNEAQAIQVLAQNINIQGAPGDMLSGDIRNNLWDALATMYAWPFIVGHTSEHVVYEVYSHDLDRWAIFQQAFDMDADGKVTFTADPEEVRLLTRIVPVGEGDLNVNQGEENEMPLKANEEGQTTDVEGQEDETVTPEAEAEAAEPTVETEEVVETPAEPAPAPTAQEYIDNAPAEVRDMLNSALSTHNSAKAGVIKALKATNRCNFSDDALNAMSLQELENLQSLANVPSYEGRTAPVAQSTADEGVPPAPKVFGNKPKEVA